MEQWMKDEMSMQVEQWMKGEHLLKVEHWIIKVREWIMNWSMKIGEWMKVEQGRKV